MKAKLITMAALATVLCASSASAQTLVNLSGAYRCVQNCMGGPSPIPAFVTQNGWGLNVVNEVGVASRAWIDYPGHIWLQNWNEGAVYSPDGMTIQFDNGAVWERYLGPPPAPRVHRRG